MGAHGSTGARKRGPHLDVLEHVRVVADLPQLHDGVHQGLGATFALQRKNESHIESCPRVEWDGGWKEDCGRRSFRGRYGLWQRNEE